MKEEFSYKKSFIYRLSDINETISEDGRISLLTSAGLVSGKLSLLETYKITDDKDLGEQLKEIAKENDGINIRRVALTMLENSFEKRPEDNWVDTTELIMLEDATYVLNNGQKLELPEITVFLSQIVGIIAGGVE